MFPILTWPLTSHRDAWISPFFTLVNSQVCRYHPERLCPLWCQTILVTKQTKASLGRFQITEDWKPKYHKNRTQPIWYWAEYHPDDFCLPRLSSPEISQELELGTQVLQHQHVFWAFIKFWNFLMHFGGGWKVHVLPPSLLKLALQL